MKPQYLGDVNDYYKFALLRSIHRETGLKVGVCWMLTPNDASFDGGNRRFASLPNRWRVFDPALFDRLKHLPPTPQLADLIQFEAQAIAKDFTYFNDVVPAGRSDRLAYHEHCMDTLSGVDLIFFDPDNGLRVKTGLTSRLSPKHVFYDEVAAHYAAGRSALVYQHFPRKQRHAFISEIAGNLRNVLQDVRIWAFSTHHVVFLLAATPVHAEGLSQAVATLTDVWATKFFVSISLFAPSATQMSPTAIERKSIDLSQWFLVPLDFAAGLNSDVEIRCAKCHGRLSFNKPGEKDGMAEALIIAHLEGDCRPT